MPVREARRRASRRPATKRGAPTRAEPTYEDLRDARRGAVAKITINRPRSYNAYTTETLRELAAALEAASSDDRVGVIVLTGSGSQAFCTGGDVKEYAQRYTTRPHDYWKYMGHFQRAIELLLTAGKPTIARLNGITVGGGNELHLACDLSIAASHVYLGQVGVGVGSVACGGATQWLPITVGDRRARAMLLLNERIPAAKAESWGLVTQVAPSIVRDGKFLDAPTAEEIVHARNGEDGLSVDLTKLDDAVEAMSARLLSMFPECLRYTRQQANFWKEFAWHSTVGHGREWLSLHFAHPEPLEGMRAFAEKRSADVAGVRRRWAAGGSVDYLYGPPTRECPSCHAKNLPEQLRFCGRCGRPLPPIVEVVR